MFHEILTDNPIVTRELRRRMRGKAMIYSLIAYVGLLCIVTLVILLVKTAGLIGTQAASVAHLEKLQQTGDMIFNGMVVIQGLLVLIMAPAITASLITSERERKTDDFLRVTTLPPYHYVVGAFFSTALYVLLLLGCALPIVSVSLLFGGRALSDIFLMFGGLLMSSIVLISLGIYTSSIHEKTRTAQGVMLGLAIVFIILVFNLPRLLDAIYFYLSQSSPAPFGSGKIPLFGWTIPDWVCAAAPPLGLSLIFLLVASRKVYHFDNRPLSYPQFFVIAAIVLIALAGLGFSAKNNMHGVTLILWCSVSLALLIIAAVIFNIHQVEVGSENWRLHQRLPALAIIDDAILYILLLLGCWWLAGQWLFERLGGASYRGWFNILAVNIACPVLFLAVTGRALALKITRRQTVFNILAGGIAALWIVLPLIILLPFGGIDKLSRNNQLFMFLVDASPVYAVLHCALLHFDQAARLPQWGNYPGQLQSAVYLLLAGLLYLIVLRENRKWQDHLRAIILNASRESIEKELGLSGESPA